MIYWLFFMSLSLVKFCFIWHEHPTKWLYSISNAIAYCEINVLHYDDVIMSAIASQITSLTIVYSTVSSGADQSKHQSSASLAFVCGIHRGPVNSPHKWPVTRKMFPFDDVIMNWGSRRSASISSSSATADSTITISHQQLNERAIGDCKHAKI